MIVRREDNGFGFTLTQEMPVFVDKVFNGSSAQKAGIHPKDRIIKVRYHYIHYTCIVIIYYMLCTCIIHAVCIHYIIM